MLFWYVRNYAVCIVLWGVMNEAIAKPDELVDLTHTFDATTVYWPTEGNFELELEHAEVTDKGYYYASNRFSAPEHGGTHIDAPVHFAKNQQTLDKIPLDRLVGPGILIDITANCTKTRDYQITHTDFAHWEAAHGSIPPNSIVLLRTGYAQYWPDRKRYLGTDGRGPDALRELRFPGLHPQAAEWLVQQRCVKAVGIDTASIDYGQSTIFQSHQILTANNVPIFENIGELARLPATGFEVIALPMKIGGGSGGPLRIIARVGARK
jgi:kynurenine formamidase